MRNVAEVCVQPTTDSKIKFEENKRKIIFLNPDRHDYKGVQVDGCAMKALHFKRKYHSELLVRGKQLEVALY